MRTKRLWLALVAVVVGSFAVLGYYGVQIYRQAPPIPAQVVDAQGRVLFTGQEIKDGQNVWQSMGGQEVGSIWGHGAYQAPDWSADWLHRESLMLLDRWARREHGVAAADLDDTARGALRARLEREFRTNTYDIRFDHIVLSEDRAAVVEALGGYYKAIFMGEAAFPAEVAPFADGGLTPAELRDAYAIPSNAIRDAERQDKMNAFFFWAAWACATERPRPEGMAATAPAVTYTNNWPAEPLINNRPSGAIVMWSVASVILLLAGIGLLAWHHAVVTGREEEPAETPLVDPLRGITMTPSMKATLKYFWVVAGLIVAQVGLGGVTAHFGVEGNGFYGIPLAEWLPYAVTRTWHTQLGIFWIATAWLATGLFIAPAISGVEPKFQRAGVNFLWGALLVIVVGSMFGTWYGTRQQMGYTMNFWLGHQGYEYVDLGRFWQIFLMVGLLLWLGLMTRAMWPAFKKFKEQKHLLALFLLSSTAIALFYGAGLAWGRQTHLAMAEYWRWWLVHLWVEGFFEVFATVVIALLFTRMGLLRVATATAAVLFATTIFLSGGIIGTMHHLYFSGTPTGVLALGAVFSALEIVPLTLVGFEAYENWKLAGARPWVTRYKWPILFFISVAFWNLVGAGVFGFLINPPIALYYMQGLNTTPVHAHTALFGVYGMLGIGLMLFCLRAMAPGAQWRTRWVAFSFWALNAGLILMVVLSLLPIGLLQASASIDTGLWFARSAEFLQTPLMETLRWMRMFGDTVFAAGAMALVWFIFGLKTGWSLEKEEAPVPGKKPERVREEEVLVG